MTRIILPALAVFALATAARAADPPAGAVCTLPVVSVALDVGSTEREAKRVVYSPPPGWYVRSHRVECGRRYGLASYAVSTVPAGWRWASDATATGTDRFKAAAGGTGHVAGYGGELAGEIDGATAARERTRASHHSLVVDVSARGAGLWRGGGGIELTVVAEMVYVGGAGR